MAALRADGWSLDEIAARFEVSRERVRQILRAQGGGPGPQDVVAARRRRVEAQAEARIDELLALWRVGEDPTVLAAKLGLQPSACRATIERFATAVDRAARQSSLAPARGVPTYSDEDILAALISAATRLGRVPSAKDYRTLARHHRYPSLPTVLNRMGGWSAAVAAAGLPVSRGSGYARPRRWTEEACWDALRLAVEALGDVPSVLAYERFAAGRDDVPSSATVRNRLGRWSSVTARLVAQRELSQQSQTRVLAVHGALANA